MTIQSGRCDPMTRQQIEAVTIIKTIVHWQHQRGGQAHCLIRAYAQPEEQLVVVLSELRSNEVFRGISVDVNGVVNALFECFQSELSNVNSQSITWIVHYGKFSSYDAIGEDVFIQLDLIWNGRHFEDYKRDHRLTHEKVEELLKGLELESVYQVLREIGWTKHNENG